MNNDTLQIGDMIRIDRPGYKHVGVYVGPQWPSQQDVIHNQKGGGVKMINFAEFSDGCAVFIHRKAIGDHFQRQQIVQRALQLIGTKYDLLKFNCEHAANLAQNGRADSPQLRGFAMLALLLIGGVALFGGKKLN
jgi:hypothetical protein